MAVASAREYLFEKAEYPIEIIRKNNKNTYIRVKNNTIIVTTNYLVSEKKILSLIEENRPFIDKMLKKSIDKGNDKSFKIFGHIYDVVYGFPDTSVEDGKIYTKDEKTLNTFLSKYIQSIYAERLDYWYHQFTENIPTPHLKIRKMTSRWGVCNIKNKNITLNRELVKYDIRALDYVIVHELSHFIYPNHSKSFWLLVSKYYPKYKEVRKYLKDSG